MCRITHERNIVSRPKLREQLGSTGFSVVLMIGEERNAHPKEANNGAERLLSSTAIRETAASTARARSVRSPRCPMGVATTKSVPAAMLVRSHLSDRHAPNRS